MKKSKLIATLCTLVLTLACLTFGVYSAVKTSFTASGTITFNAYSVECDVAIKIVGAEGGDRVLYATTNKANSKRTQNIITRTGNDNLGLMTNYNSESSAFVIGGADSLNLGDLKFDELNTTKTDAQRRTITMEVYVINYSDYAIEFLADADGQNGDGSVTYSRQLGTDAIELDKYENGKPTSNVGENTTFTYTITFTANSQTSSTANASAFNIGFTIKPASGKTGAQATAYQFATKDDFVSATKDVSSTETEPWIKCSNETKNKMIVPLLYCNAEKTTVYAEKTAENQLIDIVKGDKYDDAYDDLLSVPMFRTQTQLIFCDGYTSMGDYVFSEQTYDENTSEIQCASNLKSIILPKSIETFSLRECVNLVSAIFPEGITSIGSSAFSGCSNLTTITIPNGVNSIGYQAFNGCSSLTTITIQEGVTSIEDRVFYDCSSLTTITIPSGVTSIGIQAFYGCSSLTTITIPASVTSIGADAFDGCTQLTGQSITGESNVKYLGYTNNDNFVPTVVYKVTDKTALSGEYAIPNTCKFIYDSAFSSCRSLTAITIPASVTSIGIQAFNGCSSLTTIEIPDSITSIGYQAFSGCSNLTTITIPNGVNSIGYLAFSGCSSLTRITCNSSNVGTQNIGLSLYFTPTGGTTKTKVSTWQTGTGVYTKT